MAPAPQHRSTTSGSRPSATTRAASSIATCATTSDSRTGHGHVVLLRHDERDLAEHRVPQDPRQRLALLPSLDELGQVDEQIEEAVVVDGGARRRQLVPVDERSTERIRQQRLRVLLGRRHTRVGEQRGRGAAVAAQVVGGQGVGGLDVVEQHEVTSPAVDRAVSSMPGRTRQRAWSGHRVGRRSPSRRDRTVRAASPAWRVRRTRAHARRAGIPTLLGIPALRRRT